ncbi:MULTISPECIES: hypothetical protein [unclassified Mesobacillus]|uniref:YphA family membrane protein n=1 Tax=unclassified Mesobacillus TaxID=2675270 RepID=UPI00203BF57F|nr:MULTISPECIES: hypothetical protein [unclassified Mesobacillus]MCM3122212.1 hypothetical protein [Mesobacillus sp. MER 33]MCM3232176.1 hypothetical protein [Mesobacillus sp. MER 48]
MEGLYFYWLAWIAWIWVTFIMGKNHPNRLKWAICLLAVIIASPYKVDFLFFKFHLSAFPIAIFIFMETKRKKTGSFLYLFLTSFIIMLAYTSFLMFELFDPVWVLFDRKLMLGAAGFYLAILLHKGGQDRMLALVTGFLQGDILYSAVLWRFNFPYEVASMTFMDILFISSGMLIAWSAVESLISIMSKTTLSEAEGEEQKTS